LRIFSMLAYYSTAQAECQVLFT